MTTDIDPQAVLDLPMGKNDAKASTVREYLATLLHVLWEEEEGFSGKRPFGNSGWQYDIYTELVKAGFIEGKVDPEYGWLDEVDTDAADAVVKAAITALAGPPASR